MTEEKKQLKHLSAWDFKDTYMEPDGYDWREVPNVTSKNFELFIEKYNELVDVLNRLNDK